MLKIAIIDDEKRARTTIKGMLFLMDKPIEIIGEASGVVDGLVLIKKTNPDIVLLDIELLDGTGFDLLEQIGVFSFKLIFITAHPNFALKAFKTNALDYIVKPLDPEELEAAIAKCEQQINLEQQKNSSTKSINISSRIVFRTADSIFLVERKEILRCESDKGYSTIHLHNGKKILVSKTLKQIETTLGTESFIRVHQSHLINIEYLQELKKRANSYVVLKDKTEVPVSHRKQQELMDFFSQIS